ncbi:MAG: hypothetical protein M3Z50_05490 [Actinomycetota bacterium]|nr:hypothetical protein [Actinomycetota bacterium]
MTWLRRSPRAVPDRSLPMFEPERAHRFSMLAREVFAEHGFETTYDDGSLRGSNGQTFGLTNVAHLAALERERSWRQVLDAHVLGLLAAQSIPKERDLDKVRDRLYLRLWASREVPFASGCRVDFGPGLVGLASIDHPAHVETLTSAADIEALGGWETTCRVARENLGRLAGERHDVGVASVHVNVGGFFNASRMLALPRLLMTELLVESPAHGVLFAVPNRHVFSVHLVQNQDVTAAAQMMAALAVKEYPMAGGISPDLWFWRAGLVEKVAWEATAERPRIDPSSGLGRALAELGLHES